MVTYSRESCSLGHTVIKPLQVLEHTHCGPSPAEQVDFLFAGQNSFYHTAPLKFPNALILIN